MFRSSIMNSDWWKCGKYASSQLWGVHIFDDVRNILGTSYSTWWHRNQRFAAKFVPICCKMTRNKTNLLCARAYRNRRKRNEISILSSDQEMKARCMVMTHEQSNSPSGRVILLPSKRVEADEVRLQEHVVCVLEQWGSSSEGVLSALPACESTVLHRSTKCFGGRCWEEMSIMWLTQDWQLHCDNTPCHADSRLFLFPVPNQNQMVVVSGLSTSPS